MNVTAIISEYNPLHKGHLYHIETAKKETDADFIIAIMSGNFVQRGTPAILDKYTRAEAALKSGVDLVLELPVTYALSSAEGFAAGGVSILSRICDSLCFGAESQDPEQFLQTAKALLSADFPEALRAFLEQGLSFPAARAAALGEDASLLANPNDILGVEYCKAILEQNSPMEIFPILREGNYHDVSVDKENPSATAVRQLLINKHDWKSCVPASAWDIFDGAPLHTLQAGERAVLAKLRTMTDSDFEALPYGSEGLWRKFMHACRSCESIDAIIAATKSKRYTYTRISRMLMCAYLGISREMLESSAPYTRVLAFNDSGRTVLKNARLSGCFPHVGEEMEDPYWDLEQRASDIYGLCRTDAISLAGLESKQRVYVNK